MRSAGPWPRPSGNLPNTHEDCSLPQTDADLNGRAATDVATRPADDINRRIVDSSEDCLKILDLDGRIDYVNSAGVRHMELTSPAGIVGRYWIDFWELEAREAAQEALASAKAGRRGVFQGPSRTATGFAKWWDVAVTPITDADGTVVQLLVVARDLTERRREEAFRAGQHDVLEMIASGAGLDDILGRLVHLIERQCDRIRCSVVLVDQEGTRMSHGVAPSMPGLFTSDMQAVTIGPRAGSCGTAIYLAKPVIVADALSDPLWEETREVARVFAFRACWSVPILSSHRKVLGSFAMYGDDPRMPRGEELRLMDIGAYIAGIAIERLQAHQALHQSEERNRAILRAIPDWMFVMTADGVFLHYHARDPAKLLVPPSAFLGRSVREVMPPALADALSAAFARALASDEPEKLEYTIGADDEERFYEATVVRCDGDKVLSIVRDITDRKRAELDAAAQRHELAHLNRVAMLGELTGALAHELSQPLAAILGNAQAARRLLDGDTLDASELRATLDDIIKNDKRAGAVIDRLRTLLKKGTSVRQPLNLNEVTREVLDLTRGDLLARRISVTTRLAPSLPLVLGDRVQLQQVVLNLVLNACDAMDETSPRERTLTLETTADDELVDVAISDCGVGIPVNQLAAVFEPFVTFRAQGLGLGLAISRSIVISHGGRITAENNHDRGVTLRCRFPISQPVPQH
jgi:PAS domain S-box-containing protein